MGQPLPPPHHGPRPHSHSHSHSHAQPPVPDSRRVLLLAIVLNLGLVVMEFGWGILANSTALLADAGHNLSDVLGLGLAWGAVVLTNSPASQRYTYGLRSASILAALANAMLLLLASGAVAWEAWHRLQTPTPVQGATVAIVAALAMAVNGFSAWLLMAKRHHDINLRAAFMHMVLDAAVSLAVLMGGLVVMWSGQTWVDPVISLVIVLIVVLSTWSLLRNATWLALNAVPAQIDLPAVQRYLLQQRGVTAVLDLHIWGISTTETALTAQLVMPEGSPGDVFLRQVSGQLARDFGIHHTTIQIVRRSLHQEAQPACGIKNL